MLDFSFLESGPDVKFNSRLEGLFEKARTISMPKEKIENAIKSGTGVKFKLNSSSGSTGTCSAAFIYHLSLKLVIFMLNNLF